MTQTSESQPELRVRFQFSLRTLHIGVFVFIVLTVLLTPFIRGFSILQQQYFFACVTIASVLTIAVLVGMCLRRRHVEREAGGLLLRTCPLANVSPLRYLTTLGPVFVLPLYAWFLVEETRRVELGGINSDIIANTACVIIAWAVVAPIITRRIWWGMSFDCLEICENGFIYGGLRLKRWDQVDRFHWGKMKPQRLVIWREVEHDRLIIKLTRRKTLKLNTHPQHKAEIERLFAAHVASS